MEVTEIFFSWEEERFSFQRFGKSIYSDPEVKLLYFGGKRKKAVHRLRA